MSSSKVFFTWIFMSLAISASSFDEELRNLRGGSGGGGGGGRGGGGGVGGAGYNSGGGYNNGSSGAFGMSIVGILTFVLLPVSVVIWCCWKRGKKNTESREKYTQSCEKAKAWGNTSEGAEQKLTEVPYSGEYSYSYQENQTGICTDGTININFANHDSGSGFKLTGSSTDRDGVTQIKDGYATNTGKAWWIERYTSGNDTGMEVVSWGLFNFGLKNFEGGQWAASTGIDGVYTSFATKDTSVSTEQAIPQAIPIASAPIANEEPTLFVPSYETASNTPFSDPQATAAVFVPPDATTSNDEPTMSISEQMMQDLKKPY